MFHVSQLKKYVPDVCHILNYSELKLDGNLSFETKPMAILDWNEKDAK